MANDATVDITGNLTKDPEMRTYNGTSVVSFTVGVNTTKKSDDNKYISDFYNVSVWGATGEYIMPRIEKGTMVQVIGDLTLQKYTGKDGNEHESLSVRAIKVKPLARMKGAPTRGNFKTQNNSNNNESYGEDAPF